MNLDDRKFLEAIGHLIRERRMALGLTQAELADRCDLHRTFIGSVERGERNLAMLSLRRIARALRVAPTDLVVNGSETSESTQKQTPMRPKRSS
jgi:transcriptional regulator with XRE-family HTH domain